MGKTMPSAVTTSAAAAAAKVKQEQEDAEARTALRQEWRELWRRRQLLTDRTEFLAVYPSDEQENEHNANNPH